MIYVLSSEIDYAGAYPVSADDSLIPIVEKARETDGDSLLIQVFQNGKCAHWCRFDGIKRERITYETVLANLKPYKGTLSD